MSELEQKGGYTIPNKANLQKIELIAEQIRTTLLEGDYVKALTEYTKTFEAHGQVVLETFDIGASIVTGKHGYRDWETLRDWETRISYRDWETPGNCFPVTIERVGGSASWM